MNLSNSLSIARRTFDVGCVLLRMTTYVVGCHVIASKGADLIWERVIEPRI